MAWVRLSDEIIPITELEEWVAVPEHGAVCVFIGQTRRQARGREVAYLDYDAYVPMAEKELRRIAESAEERWNARAAVQHRLGRVNIGEASVVIAISTPHRADAFAACRWCIDTIKEQVPIWKRETCVDGTFWIEGENALPHDPA
jgi:molybdopterin synthase catalytic subunit